MIDWITHVALTHSILIYALIVVLAFIEGHILTMVCGFLASLGYLDPFLAGIAVACGNLIGDVMWYWIGARQGERFVRSWGRYVGVTDSSIETVKRFFHTYKERIILGSKLTNGLGFAIVVLFTAGMSKVPFRRYMKLNVIGECLWTGALIVVGYVFGDLYVAVDSVMWKVAVGAFIVIVLFVAWRIYRHMRDSFLKQR